MRSTRTTGPDLFRRHAPMRHHRRRLAASVLAASAALALLAGLATPVLAAAPVQAAAPVPAAGPGDLASAMASALTQAATTDPSLGPALSGIVVDAADGTVVWRHDDTVARMPASVQKVLTAFTVLRSMSGDATLATTTCRSDATPSAVYVRGGGDPTLTVARVRDLAAQTAAQLTASGQKRVSLHLDGSLFPAPTRAAGWPASYLRSDVQYVRGLTLAGNRTNDGRLAVGAAMVAALKPLGVTVVGAGRAATSGTVVTGTPRACTPLGVTRSAPVRRMVAAMLASSDNDVAEALLRQAALARGYAPSWHGAVTNEVGRVTGAGVPGGGWRVADGSGLSREDRAPVATLAAVLRLLYNTPEDAATVFAPDALPVAGRSGTLADRFRTPAQACAQGQVQAKTGTLADAVTLAGVARGVDGRDRVFVFLDNGLRSYTAVRTALDTLATEVAGCSLTGP